MWSSGHTSACVLSACMPLKRKLSALVPKGKKDGVVLSLVEGSFLPPHKPVPLTVILLSQTKPNSVIFFFLFFFFFKKTLLKKTVFLFLTL